MPLQKKYLKELEEVHRVVAALEMHLYNAESAWRSVQGGIGRGIKAIQNSSKLYGSWDLFSRREFEEQMKKLDSDYAELTTNYYRKMLALEKAMHHFEQIFPEVRFRELNVELERYKIAALRVLKYVHNTNYLNFKFFEPGPPDRDKIAILSDKYTLVQCGLWEIPTLNKTLLRMQKLINCYIATGDAPS